MGHSWILYGRPGSGKKLLRRILESMGYHSISTGKLLLDSNDPAVERAVSRGDLVRDSTILELLKRKIPPPRPGLKIALDGAPRTLDQARFLIDLFTKTYGHHISLALLEVDPDVAMRRLLERAKRHGRVNGGDGTVIAEDVRLIKKRQMEYERRHPILVRFLRENCHSFHTIDNNQKKEIPRSLFFTIAETEERVARLHRDQH